MLFFFQAEDGIGGGLVSGVQPCALPMWLGRRRIRILNHKKERFVAQNPNAPTPKPNPLHDPPEPPAHDPPAEPLHDPPGDPTYEPPQPRTDPTPNPAADPPRKLPNGYRGGTLLSFSPPP